MSLATAPSAPHPRCPAATAAWAVPLLGAACLVAGSVFFLTGGSAHPRIGGGLGAGDNYFQAFAHEVARTDGWRPMHMQILTAPIFWALGVSFVLDGFGRGVARVASTARAALFLSAALWAVAFALDGFGAPVIATGIIDPVSPDLTGPALLAFEANAVVMSRLGLVGWVVGGAGIVLVSAILLTPGVRTTWRTVVGAAGMVLGAWPLVAALTGPYAAGPFTSEFWLPNAVAAGTWFVTLATCVLPLRRPDPSG